MAADGKTHFGFETVDAAEKASRVAGVFDTVAEDYDVMNDLMSLGLHRAWKAFTVLQAGVRPHHRALDIAGGTGDIALALYKASGRKADIWLTDINEKMLSIGRDRLMNEGVVANVCACDAEELPFASGTFDRVTVAFGLRNMTDKDRALKEMHRVLKPGGKLLVLEFSKVWAPLSKLYDIYSFNVLPWLGDKVAGSPESYRYLAESIRMHPDQQTLGKMMEEAGFVGTRYFNLTAGVVALHTGLK